MVYSAKHGEYQLVVKSTVPCFYNWCYFHNVDFFCTVVCPRCAPGIGGTTQIWGRGTLKKISRRFAPEFVAQLQNRVSAYAWGL